MQTKEPTKTFTVVINGKPHRANGWGHSNAIGQAAIQRGECREFVVLVEVKDSRAYTDK